MKRFLFIFILLSAVPMTAGAKTLKVGGNLSQTHIKASGPTELWATINVSAGQIQSDVRAPLNLGLVIDRSTSMADGKLVQAKKAGVKLIEMLQASDRIAVVSYGSDVTLEHPSVLATPGNKELLINAINNVELAGSTNLSGGYNMARQVVLKESKDSTVNRVLLLSDGHANVGVTTQFELGQLANNGLLNGVSLTTMGIGLDYNEDIMTEMAQQGAGQYYFIDDAKKLASMFESEFKGLAATVARKTNLVLTAAPGVEILEIKGFKSSSKGSKTTIRLAEFYSNQRKDILVKLSISPRAKGKNQVLTATIGYDDVTNSNKRAYNSRKLSATTTDNMALLKKKDRQVMRRVQQVKTGEALVKAMEEQERGNVEEARKVVQAQRSSNSQFMKDYDFEDDGAFVRVDKELKSVEKSVAKPSSAPASKRMRKAKKKRAYDMAAEAAAF